MIASVILFLAVLSILVLVHELGHFFAAVRSGIKVEEFGVGYPPKVFAKKIKGVIYSVNLLPFGGFVRLHGEDSSDNLSDPKRAFVNKPKLVRVYVIIAGVVMNFILAIVCFSIVYSFSGIPMDTENVKIVEVDKDSPAESTGLLPGDIVKKINTSSVSSNSDFISEVEKNKGESVNLEIDRNGETVSYSVTPRENPPEGKGALGVVISTVDIVYPPLWKRPFYGVYYGFKEAIFWGGLVIGGFGQLITSLLGGSVPEGISGPVGIYALTSKAASFGLLALVNFMGILSVNLAILNIVPFPALDGGRLAFILIEAVTRRKVSPRVEAMVHTVGMIVLLAIVFLITAKDVKELILAGSLSGFLDSITK